MALIDYCLKENKNPDWTNIKIVGKARNEEHLRIAENIIIEKAKSNNCNISTGSLLPYPWRLIIQEGETMRKEHIKRMKGKKEKE